MSPFQGAYVGKTTQPPPAAVGDVLGRQQAAGQKTRTSGFDSPDGHSAWRPTATESTDNQHTRPRNHD